MLTEEEKQEIRDEIKLYPYPHAACVDALKIVQAHRSWISDDAIRDVADFLGMSRAEVDGVATFYSRLYRHPVGRHVILICDSMSCLVMGYESIYEHVAAKLGIRFGQTTADNRFTLLPVSCLGDCDHAPSMMIDQNLYSDLTFEKADQLLSEFQ